MKNCGTSHIYGREGETSGMFHNKGVQTTMKMETSLLELLQHVHLKLCDVCEDCGRF